ncbi:AfsR/SARP family transcriptional regulator [Jiangella muralis]|uniref:AfsR/SARP family transcriptional regulator n=1 Tax=Jiangella muralis TaxID=702383 RepID=UPI00069F83E7|nr:BTAD domain-containing putative transcriptional regulator [Jiangella muralis]
MGSQVRIGLLGPFELLVGGRPVHLAGDRQRAVLAALASSAGTAISADTLGDLVWGDDPPQSVRRTVQTLVLRLRRQLGTASIVSRPPGYALTIDPDHVDVLRFDRLLNRTGGLADPVAELRTIAEALRLWRGRPYGDAAAGRLEEIEAPRLTERYLQALERATDLLLDCNAGPDAGLAGSIAERVRAETERHPLRESLWARHLRLLEAADRGAEALTTYEAVRVRLADELGVDPGPELRRLHAGLLRQPAPAASPAATAAPAAPAAPPLIRQLPGDLELVGRERELAQLDDAMGVGHPAAAGARLATLTGPGGAGKTALAVHWAHRTQSAFPDGQLFLDLRGFSADAPLEPGAALRSLLSSLGVPPEQQPDDVDARAGLYRSLVADRRILVVLDNARDSAQVRPLLPGGAGRAIITSRGALRGLSAREGARGVLVDQVTVADATSLLRVRLRRHRVTLPEPVLAELAELCGRLPLALVIAAEYVAAHHEQGAERLIPRLREERSRLDALDEDGDDPLISMRSVFSWSYAALDPGTARTFRTMAWLLPVDFGPELVAAVTRRPLPRATRVLDRLADLHLATASGGRYRCHDLMRSYAAERAEIEDDQRDLDAAEARCVDWYLYSLRNAMDVVKPIDHRAATLYFPAPAVPPLRFDDPVVARAWCAAEARTLAFLARRAHDTGRYGDAWRMAWQLGRFLLLAAHSDDHVELARLAVDAAAHVDPAALYIAENGLGTALRQSWRPEATVWFERALDGCRAAGDPGTESVVRMNLAVAVHHSGDVEGAVEQFTAALNAARHWEATDPQRSMLSPNLAALHLNLGNSLTALERHPEGIEHTAQALALARSGGNRIIEGMSLGNLAESYSALGDYAAAEDHCRRAAAVLRSISASDGLVDVLLTTVEVMTATGRPDDARAAYDEAMAILRDTDDPRAGALAAALR